MATSSVSCAGHGEIPDIIAEVALFLQTSHACFGQAGLDSDFARSPFPFPAADGLAA